MSFWETVGANFVAGAGVALLVAGLAWGVTDSYARKKEAERGRHERNLDAARELSTVMGRFFGAWKAWNHSMELGPGLTSRGPTSDLRRELTARASDVEGAYEALLYRIAIEHRLSADDRAALWAMRFALKQLRYSMREDVPLQWWRSDIHPKREGKDGYNDYLAFKTLVARVASILVDADPRIGPPSLKERSEAITEITGPGTHLLGSEKFSRWITGDPTRSLPANAWVRVAEALKRPGVEPEPD